MLNNILETVKEIATSTVSKNTDVPADKKDLVVNTATDSIASGLMNNIGDLTNLLGNKGASSGIMNTIQKTVVEALMQKAGLNSNIATNLVSSLLPTVISALSGKINNKEEGFSLESVLGALGGEKKGSALGNTLNSLGKLFK